ncbi:MAG: aminoglycoside phosphotransferase protein [Devosia sp.]|uniref:phosphotransferase family protein n=1 Tax=Devosia sp. TaxID=1871048 RepID=UPI002607711A|nr:aminoglycoside phosphotransferase family protein [Devosia sp.]MDB5538720.1 aminoglycoside phosphotransferase protein [Devosia sp.]
MAQQEIGPRLGSGKMAEAFAYGDAVLKLYRAPGARAQAFGEAAILAIVAEHGLPTPQVLEAGRFAGRWGVVMTRAEGKPLAESEPSIVPAALEEMVRLHLAIHARPEPRLRPLKSRLADRIAHGAQLDDPVRKVLLAHLATLPDGNRLCHGDFHPFNIIGPPGATTVVDWPDATSGPPAADACRSYLLMHGPRLDLADAYLARYAARSGLAPTEILAWLPTLAAARLTEDVPEEVPRLLDLARGVSPAVA